MNYKNNDRDIPMEDGLCEYSDLRGKYEMDEMNMVNNEANVQSMYGQGITVAAQCVVEIQKRYFLLIELEAKNCKTEFERVIVIEISRGAFEFLRSKGVKECEVVPYIPCYPGKEQELKCTFVVGSNAYIIVEVESKYACDKLIVVKSPICNIIC